MSDHQYIPYSLCPKCGHAEHNQHDCIRCTCDHQKGELYPRPIPTPAPTTNAVPEKWLSAEPLPCPFCGAKPHLLRFDDVTAIECGNFDTCHVNAGIRAKTREEAVIRWNDRPYHRALLAELAAATRELPKTADGKPVRIGGEAWWKEIARDLKSEPAIIREVRIDARGVLVRATPTTLEEITDEDGNHQWYWIQPERFYSTREAALAASRPGGEPGTAGGAGEGVHA